MYKQLPPHHQIPTRKQSNNPTQVYSGEPVSILSLLIEHEWGLTGRSKDDYKADKSSLSMDDAIPTAI